MAHKLLAREMTDVEFTYYRKYLNANWHIFACVDGRKWRCLGGGRILSLLKVLCPEANIDQIIWRLKDSDAQKVVCRLTAANRDKVTLKFYAI